MKYFIGVGDGYEGYGGNWGEFHKCLERPEDAEPQLVEVGKEQFVEYLTNNKEFLDVDGGDEEILKMVESDEELFFTSNGNDDSTLADNLNVLAEEHEIEQPGYDEEDE